MGNSIKTKVRDSRFEILRIIAMFLIVTHHFTLHGFELEGIEFSYNKIIIDILALGGKLGVNLFVLITAYFMVEQKFKYKRLIKLFGEIWFYSIAGLIVFVMCVNTQPNIGITIVLKSIFPIIFGKYWFVTTYVLLMIFSPYLNKIIEKFEKKDLKNLILTSLILIVVVSGTIPKALKEMSTNIIWFSILYLTIGYIKKYVDLHKKNKKINLLIGLISYFLLILSSVVLNILGHKLNDNSTILSYSTYFSKQNSIFVFIASIEIFLFFTKLPIIENKFINKIAGCTLGVYLIHDNGLLREYLWNTIFKNQQYYFSPYLIIYAIVVIFVVYIGCTIIDLIRQKTIEKVYLKVANKLYDKCERNLVKFKEKFNTKFVNKSTEKCKEVNEKVYTRDL